MEVVSRGVGNTAGTGSVTMGDVGGLDIDMDMFDVCPLYRIGIFSR